MHACGRDKVRLSTENSYMKMDLGEDYILERKGQKEFCVYPIEVSGTGQS
jgi:hypothetical protein